MSHSIVVDDKFRVRIPELEPGGTYQVEHPSPDVFVLRRMKPAADKLPKPRLVRRNGRLVFVGWKRITKGNASQRKM